MALLAEELVEEWLNRKGFFTIRGIKLGVDEIDLVGIKKELHQFRCVHVEVCVSMNPVSYISNVPKKTQKETGKSANSAKRSSDEIEQGVNEFVEKKFLKPRKISLLKELFPSSWDKLFVVHKVKDEKELDLIAAKNIEIIRLETVLEELSDKNPVPAAAGNDLFNLVSIKKNL